MNKQRSWLNFAGNKRFHRNTFLTILCLVSVTAFSVLLLNVAVLMQSIDLMDATTINGTPVLHKMVLCSLGAILVIMAGSFFVVYIYSQKIAGPLHRLQKTIRHYSEGQKYQPLNFRQDDEFREIGDAFNTMHSEMNKRLGAAHEFIEKIEKSLKPLSSSKAELKTIEEALGQLKEVLLMKEN